MIFSESTGFYSYSSLLQANAAILSILGIFTIFRVQSFQSAIETIKNSFILSRDGFSPFIGSKYNYFSCFNNFIEWD